MHILSKITSSLDCRWGSIDHRAALSAFPRLLTFLEPVDSLFDLSSQICTMECGLVDYFIARGTVPTKLIDTPFRPLLFNDDPNLHVSGQFWTLQIDHTPLARKKYRIRESDGIVRHVRFYGCSETVFT